MRCCSKSTSHTSPLRPPANKRGTWLPVAAAPQARHRTADSLGTHTRCACGTRAGAGKGHVSPAPLPSSSTHYPTLGASDTRGTPTHHERRPSALGTPDFHIARLSRHSQQSARRVERDALDRGWHKVHKPAPVHRQVTRRAAKRADGPSGAGPLGAIAARTTGRWLAVDTSRAAIGLSRRCGRRGTALALPLPLASTLGTHGAVGDAVGRASARTTTLATGRG